MKVLSIFFFVIALLDPVDGLSLKADTETEVESEPPESGEVETESEEVQPPPKPKPSTKKKPPPPVQQQPQKQQPYVQPPPIYTEANAPQPTDYDLRQFRNRSDGGMFNDWPTMELSTLVIGLIVVAIAGVIGMVIFCNKAKERKIADLTGQTPGSGRGTPQRGTPQGAPNMTLNGHQLPVNVPASSTVNVFIDDQGPSSALVQGGNISMMAGQSASYGATAVGGVIGLQGGGGVIGVQGGGGVISGQSGQVSQYRMGAGGSPAFVVGAGERLEVHEVVKQGNNIVSQTYSSSDNAPPSAQFRPVINEVVDSVTSGYYDAFGTSRGAHAQTGTSRARQIPVNIGSAPAADRGDLFSPKNDGTAFPVDTHGLSSSKSPFSIP